MSTVIPMAAMINVETITQDQTQLEKFILITVKSAIVKNNYRNNSNDR